ERPFPGPQEAIAPRAATPDGALSGGVRTLCRGLCGARSRSLALSSYGSLERNPLAAHTGPAVTDSGRVFAQPALLLLPAAAFRRHLGSGAPRLREADRDRLLAALDLAARAAAAQR